MANAQRTQNRSLFWLEVVIAADSIRSCKTVAAAVQSRRGENRLHRRVMILRQRLYRRRFPRALGPDASDLELALASAHAGTPARRAGTSIHALSAHAPETESS